MKNSKNPTIDDVRQQVGQAARTNPLEVVLGAADLTVGWLREELPLEVQQERAKKLTASVKALPGLALQQGLLGARKAAEGYETLGERGKKLAGRIRHQKATQDLVEKAETTVAAGKGAVTTARKATRTAAKRTTTRAKAATTSARKTVKATAAATTAAAEKIGD